jgi:hypothetical protein
MKIKAAADEEKTNGAQSQHKPPLGRYDKRIEIRQCVV